MPDQLTIYDVLVDDASEDEPPVEMLFAPDGRRRCPHCRQRLTAFGGRLYCMRPGCSGGAS